MRIIIYFVNKNVRIIFENHILNTIVKIGSKKSYELGGTHYDDTLYILMLNLRKML